MPAVHRQVKHAWAMFLLGVALKSTQNATLQAIFATQASIGGRGPKPATLPPPLRSHANKFRANDEETAATAIKRNQRGCMRRGLEENRSCSA
jgi:hypothetical protein